MSAPDSLEDGYRDLQRFLLQFGEALQWWPEVIATAKRLSSDELRIGQVLNASRGTA